MECLSHIRTTNFSVHFNNAFVGITSFFSREQHIPPSRNVNLVFIVSSLLSLLQVMAQGQTKSLFQTHPITIYIAITSLLLYGLAHETDQWLSTTIHPSPVCVNIARRGMMVFGSLLLASLASVLLPHAIQPLLYVLYLFAYAAHELQTWLHGRVTGEIREIVNGRLPV